MNNMKTFRLLTMLAAILLLANVAQPSYGQKDIVVRKPSTTQKSGATTTKKSTTTTTKTTTTSKSSGTAAKKTTTTTKKSGTNSQKSSSEAVQNQKAKQEHAEQEAKEQIVREAAEQAIREKVAKEQAERERIEREQAEKERTERERIAKEKAAREQVQHEEAESARNKPIVYETVQVDNVSFRMVKVEGGTFTMGATPEQETDAGKDEEPPHQVTLSTYYIGETEVTQELWETVMGKNKSCFKGPRRPVESVSWKACHEFINKLNSITGRNFRLPTEAEWEYAARGGQKSKGYKYAGSDNQNDVAWYEDNCGKEKTHDVGMKYPNELGLYDMSGNVWEWCQDIYGSYPSSPQTNPQGVSSGSRRVFRGGSWINIARSCSVSHRRPGPPLGRDCYLGLRLACSAR